MVLFKLTLDKHIKNKPYGKPPSKQRADVLDIAF